jgi:hypothetical protein
MIGGTPCPPFSAQRANKATQSVSQHPEFPVTFGNEDSLLRSLAVQQPRGGVLEQVPRFATFSEDLGCSPLELFIERLKNIKKVGSARKEGWANGVALSFVRKPRPETPQGPSKKPASFFDGCPPSPAPFSRAAFEGRRRSTFHGRGRLAP